MTAPLANPVRPTSIDTHLDASLFYYCNTFTSPNDFTADQEAGIVDWHRSRAEYCFLVREYHGDGRKHYHSLLAVKSPKSAGAVTKNLERLYCKLELQWTKGVSVKVKKMTCFTGQLHYLIKDLKGDKPLLLIAWTYTWIKDTCKASLKTVPNKVMLGDTFMLQKNTAVNRVLAFAAAAGVRITCKETFIDLCLDMQEEGYQFDNIKKSNLLTNVMSRVGARQAARNVWESELFHF